MTETEIRALIERHSQSVFELLKSMKAETNRIFQQIELDAKVSKIRVKEIAIELAETERCRFPESVSPGVPPGVYTGRSRYEQAHVSRTSFQEGVEE
jgi:hypothetical protein